MADKPIWAPWRMDYITRDRTEDGCVFCDMPEEGDDKKHNILHRGDDCYILLNLFPYNSGHIMVAPFRHISDYDAMTDDELKESAYLTQKSISILKDAFNPDGFNIGVNQGKVAGAGIDEHLHIHIVPRWSGDFNFMPIIGQTNVIPQHLTDTYDTLHSFFNKKD